MNRMANHFFVNISTYRKEEGLMPQEKKKQKQFFSLTSEERQEIKKENEHNNMKHDAANKVFDQLEKKYMKK